jgi:glycerophosphoryl diester phosphodiesterase
VENLHVLPSGLDRVCLGSFHWLVLRAVRRHAPSAATGASRKETRLAVYGSWLGLRPRRPAYRALQVPERSGRTRVVSPRFIRLAHGAGVPVQVWTVNGEDDMRRLLDWGVDALITDRPDIAVPIVRAHPPARWRHGLRDGRA